MKIEHKNEQPGKCKKHSLYESTKTETVAIFTIVVAPIITTITALIYHFM